MHRLKVIKELLANNLKKKGISVGWILCGNEQVGSSRIHGINLHNGLLCEGIRSFLIQAPKGYVEKLDISLIDRILIQYSQFDVVIFQRVYDHNAILLCRLLRKSGTKCGFFVADLYNAEMLYEVDFILTPSEFLRKQLIAKGINAARIFFLPDAIETAPSMRKHYLENYNDLNQEIKIVWVGAEGHWNTVDPIRCLLKKKTLFKRFKLITISNHQFADIKWSINSIWNDILSCDIGIVPVDLTKPEALVKSNNRVTMYMALGMPVICSPLETYSKLITQGVNGFVAFTESDWATYIYELRNINRRRNIGNAAFLYAHAEFSRERIIMQLRTIINDVLS